jgi:hypothetical protein
MEQAVSELAYPEMRQELLLHLSHLADRDYQTRVWVDRQFPKPGYYDDFDTTFEAVEDILSLSRADDAVGMTLRDHQEAAALTALGTVLDRIFAEHGTELSDAQYLGLPEWSEVIDAARAAVSLLTAQA